jgi:hypothetical protein
LIAYKWRMRRSRQQEESIARDGHGRRNAGSGNQPGIKGDVTLPSWLVEAKQTVTVRYTMTLSTWRAIEAHALRKGKEPVVVVEMAGRKFAWISYDAWLSWTGQG